MEKNEPAFPIGAMLEVPELSGHTLAGNDPRPALWSKPKPGLSKREKFAESAMKALLSNMGTNRWTDEKLAIRSVKIADLVLAQLERPSNEND